jgi:hypothetical protein
MGLSNSRCFHFAGSGSVFAQRSMAVAIARAGAGIDAINAALSKGFDAYDRSQREEANFAAD